MPKWIHDRAMELKKDMKKTYGPKKAEQVAFAVATQQAHRLGKSPKTFKSKATGRKERFGTPEGRRDAKRKFDRPLKEYKKTAAFSDEIEKIALSTGKRRVGVSDFIAGVDPTGGATFQYGMKDAEDPSRSARAARALGTAGGVVGGAAVVPSAISGLIGAGRGAARTPGGIGARLAGAGKGFLEGAAKPFRQISRSVGAKGVMKKVQREGAEKLTQADVEKLKRFGDIVPGGSAVQTALKITPEQLAAKTPNLDAQMALTMLGGKLPASELERARIIMGRMSPEQLAAAQGKIRGQLAGGLTTLGTSGILGGGSAYLQYGKGQQAAQRYLGQGHEKGGSAGGSMTTDLQTNEQSSVTGDNPYGMEGERAPVYDHTQLSSGVKSVAEKERVGDLKKLFPQQPVGKMAPNVRGDKDVAKEDSDNPVTPELPVKTAAFVAEFIGIMKEAMRVPKSA